MSDLAPAAPKDTNGTLSLVFAATVPLFLGPVGAVLAIVFAGRSRRALGYRSRAALIGLVVGWLAVAFFVSIFVIIFLFSRANLTF